MENQNVGGDLAIQDSHRSPTVSSSVAENVSRVKFRADPATSTSFYLGVNWRLL